MELISERRIELLHHGEIEVVGRVAWSSNAALLVTLADAGDEMLAVYKPQRGERPLWDFPDGTLCLREVATCVLSDALGWGLIPETILRDGPYGLGAMQRFVDHDPEEHYFTMLEAHTETFFRFAVFDAIINNADRKGGHCLLERSTNRVFGIDHGLTFHPAPKLRTVIWDFAAQPIPPEIGADLTSLRTRLDGDLRAEVGELLSTAELEATEHRIDDLLAAGRLPVPDEGYHSVPWPLI